MSLVKELYEPYVLHARARISTDPVMRRLVDPAIEPLVLERFFIQLNSLGVGQQALVIIAHDAGGIAG